MSTAAPGQLPAATSAPDVLAFTKLFGLTDSPILLDYQDEGYGPDWCHVSAKHHARLHGGSRVHGWALWQYDGMILADFHSVWDDGEKLVDVTPPKFNAKQVMFVRDRAAEIYQINDAIVFQTNRSSLPTAPFWWNGAPTTEQVWGLPRNTSALLAYCEGLGFPVDSIETESGIG